MPVQDNDDKRVPDQPVIDPSIDNMLKITSDGRKLGLDPRLIDPAFEDNPDTKLNRCVENVAPYPR